MKRLKNLFKRITGISTPLGGISWAPASDNTHNKTSSHGSDTEEFIHSQKKSQPETYDELAEQIENAPYSIHLASDSDIKWISQKGTQIYSNSDVLPEKVKLSWRKKCPSGFYAIKDRTKHLIGSVELLPIKKSRMLDMINGDISEKDIKGDDLYSAEELDKVECIYIENVIMLTRNNSINGWAFYQCLPMFKKIIAKIVKNTSLVTVYAMPVNEILADRKATSEKLLKKFGFVNANKSTKQGYHIYQISANDLLCNIDNYCRNKRFSIEV